MNAEPQLQTYSHFDASYTIELPAEWEVDDSGIDKGILLAGDTEAWSMGFCPNILLTERPLEPNEAPSVETAMAVQQELEPTLADNLADYRLVHFDYGPFGTTPAEVPVDGVMRAASYTNQEGVPLMLHQWAGRHAGVDLSLTVTFPTADLPAFSEASWNLAALLVWKATREDVK